MEKPNNVFSERYNVIYYWGAKEFLLTECHPREDECKFLLMKVLEQAIRDYLNLEASTIPVEKQYFETASGLIFDTTYEIDFGEDSLSLIDILHILDVEVDWFREKVVELKEKKAKEFTFGKE